MILKRQFYPGFSRRVVGLYLLFCLLAVGWLGVAVIVTAQAVVSSRSESVQLSMLGQAASIIEVDYVRHGDNNFSGAVSRIRSDNHLTYCFITGVNGRILAHSSAEKVGATVSEPEGTRLRWGEVDCVSFADPQGRSMREYRVPLRANRRHIGYLHAGTTSQELWLILAHASNFAPLALLMPLLLMGAGAVIIARQSSSVGQIETELRRVAKLPLGENIAISALRPVSAGAVGWNRIVEKFNHLPDNDTQNNLRNQLEQVAEAGQQPEGNSILMHLTDGVAVAGSNGNIIQANPAMAALLGSGTDAETLLGKRVEQLLPADANDTLKHFTHSEKKQLLVLSEVTVEQNGAQRILRLARQPLRNADGTYDGYLWTVRDITQQKLAEKMRSEFINMATHELRTPLANIKAYAETLGDLEEGDTEIQKEFCNTINSEATRLARFVDDLLSVGSMEMGSLSIERHPVDTLRMIDEVVEKVQPLIEEKSITFDLEVPAKLPELRADKDKLVAAIVNLLGNAVKYSPPGRNVGLKVKVADDYLQIDVEDTGFGIAEEELPKVFDKFFRSGDQRVLKETGSGLGLSLVREIAKLHGGEATVTSELNMGSTFSITLPVQVN